VNWLQTSWYHKSIRSTLVSALFLPLSWLFCVITWLRRFCYRQGILKTHSISATVIIVGNINVGGTGKTPLVTTIVTQLTALGYKPGVISRGYGGKSSYWPREVDANSAALDVGDEAVLIAKTCGCPMFVGPGRVTAANQLLAHYPCDVIISDDGLQHYALGRDIEIVVLDGERGVGNGFCLPAGPLRETQRRLRTVDFIICNGGDYPHALTMQFEMLEAVNLLDSKRVKSISEFADEKVHAIAGIGNPTKFFNALSKKGIQAITHPFKDHHNYQAVDLTFDDDLAILMTEKDAVKCQSFANKNTWWVRLNVNVADEFFINLDKKIRKTHGKKIT